LDIYRVRFNDVDQKLTLFIGNVQLGDSLTQPKDFIVNVLAINEQSQEEFSFITNPTNGKLLMALPFGSYNVSVTADGYAELKDKIFVSDLGLAISEEKKSYKLKKN
jgi:hypothetical protein